MVAQNETSRENRPSLPRIIRKHGLGGFGLFCVARFLRKVANLELCKITESFNNHSYAAVDGYPMIVVHQQHPPPAGYESLASVQEFMRTHNQVLTQGHYAVLTLHGDRVVGHNFCTLSSTRVKQGILFEPGESHFYSYGAHTHEDFRGLALSPTRWTFFRDWRLAHGINTPTISYIALDNLSSLASGTGSDSVVLGYSAWRPTPGAFCFRSPGARRLGVGFKRAS